MSKYTALYRLPLPPTPELSKKHNEPMYYSNEFCDKCNNSNPYRYVDTRNCFGCLQRELKNNLWYMLNDPTGTQQIPTTAGEAVEYGADHYFTGNACQKAEHAEKLNIVTSKCMNCDLRSARQKAIAEGERYYMPETPCDKCHVIAEKRVDNGACSNCKPPRVQSARQKAIAEGKRHYTPEEACIVCEQIAPRSVNNGSCQGCHAKKPKRRVGAPEHQPSVVLMRDCPDITLGREEARSMGFKVYRTGEYCKKGHTDFRYISTGGCVKCKNLQDK